MGPGHCSSVASVSKVYHRDHRDTEKRKMSAAREAH